MPGTIGGRGRGANTNVGTGQRLDVIDVEAGDDTIRVVKVGQRRLLYAQPAEIGESGEFPADSDYDSIRLVPLDARARHTNVTGAATSLTLLSPSDSNLATLGRVYPGAAVDDNNTQWEVPVPDRMDPATTASQVTVRLHVLIPAALSVPPGGSEGAGQSGYFSVLTNSDPASPAVVFHQGDVVEVWRAWPT